MGRTYFYHENSWIQCNAERLLIQKMYWVLSAMSLCQLGEYLQLSLTLLQIQQLNGSCPHLKVDNLSQFSFKSDV